MWKILGKDAIYIDIPYVWKQGMLELAPEDEKGKKFTKIVSESEVEYLFNPQTEEHTFFIRLSDDISPDDIQSLADTTLEILKPLEFPVVEIEKTRQKYQVIITNYHEPELIGLEKTPGMSSGQVFLPIINSLSSAGRENRNFNNGRDFS